VPQTWYQVRKKVGDIAATAAGRQGPYFNDEFGDVYTNIYALAGDGFTPAQLRDYADQLRGELLHVPGVAKIDYFGERQERIYIDIGNARMTRLGISPQQLADAIGGQNAWCRAASSPPATTASMCVPPASSTTCGHWKTRSSTSTTAISAWATSPPSRGYDEPQEQEMRANGQPVLGIGVTMQPGGDVIRLGKALDAHRRIAQAPAGRPDADGGLQHAACGGKSVDDFLEAVAEAVAIVLVVSLVSLGIRTGMVVVISIPIVLAVTSLFMYMFDIGLHKVSLGTLVLALGLLVDDAIIAVEMMAVKLEQGWNRRRAAAFAYTSTAFPMLTGTLVTVAGFLPIALAKSGTGEYTRSIFEVSAIALLLSWLAAVVLIPLLGYHMLKEKPGALTDEQIAANPHAGHDEEDHDHPIYQTRIYTLLRRSVSWCVAFRGRVVIATTLLFIGSLAAFALVPQQFFPSSDRPELLIDLHLPERASFEATQREAIRMEALLKDRPQIDHYVSFVGVGAPRFYLPLDQQLASPNFAQFVVTAKSVEDREALAKALEEPLRKQFSGLRTRMTRLENGPPVGFPVQFRISGEQIPKVRAIAEQVAAEMRKESRATNIQFDWDEPAQRSVSFEIDQKRAGELGLSSQQISNFLAMQLSGSRSPSTASATSSSASTCAHRAASASILAPGHLSMPTPTARCRWRLGQFHNTLEYGVIWERNRQPTITVLADVRQACRASTSPMTSTRSSTRCAPLPVGYRIDVGGRWRKTPRRSPRSRRRCR
jgi:multidrug efflux pump subunit AcrB